QYPRHNNLTYFNLIAICNPFTAKQKHTSPKIPTTDNTCKHPEQSPDTPPPHSTKQDRTQLGK
ncbi:MAG: hypothetical protein K2L85_09310, partial [Paramuribaculum sp.]|nr:hypothetical protein [Paramuribaculum sp.]